MSLAKAAGFLKCSAVRMLPSFSLARIFSQFTCASEASFRLCPAVSGPL